jgi:two-component system NtrC family sensor kinase
MAIFVWNDTYKTGDATIDEQHIKLVALLNELGESLALGCFESMAIPVLDQLIDYADYHFSTEEAFMRSHNYESGALEDHLLIHRKFVDKVNAMRQAVDDSPEQLSRELLDFLVQWLAAHILLCDKKMVQDILNPQRVPEVEQMESDILKSNLYGALKESEFRFKELADTIPVLIWISNLEGRRIFINKQYSVLTGNSRTELNNGDWEKWIMSDDQARLKSLYQKVLAEKLPQQTEYRFISEDGSTHWILETIVPRSRDHKIVGLMGCGIDITKQKQIEKNLEEVVSHRTEELKQANHVLQQEKDEQQQLNQQLKEAQGHLIQSEKMASIGQLAAGVAHEINNPLGYIYSNLTSLQNYLTDLDRFFDMTDQLCTAVGADHPQVQAFNQLKDELDLDFIRSDLVDLVNESMEGATRAKKIVQDLRDFSRIDKQEKELFDLENGLDATLNIVHNELKYKAKIVKEYGGVEPFNCVGAQLNQVFMNLLVNAAHAIEEFGQITVRTRYKDNDKHWVVVEIQDTGKGIPDEVKAKIFDPFFTTKPVGKGTGLGLSLSYKIIQDHQGYFEVNSELGKGTTFRVLIPAD